MIKIDDKYSLVRIIHQDVNSLYVALYNRIDKKLEFVKLNSNYMLR